MSGSTSGEGIFCEVGSAPVLSFNDVWGNADGDFGGTCGPGLDDVSVDPLFELCALDYHLVGASPVIDAGWNEALGLHFRDFDEDVRILDGDGDFVPITDIGADEFRCRDNDRDGFTNCEGDCNDDDPSVNPSITEICDSVDNDCDCVSDEGFDPDGDGIGSRTTPGTATTPTSRPTRSPAWRRMPWACTTCPATPLSGVTGRRVR